MQLSNFFFSFLFLCAIESYAQNLHANYQCNYNGIVKTEELIVNGDKAITKISTSKTNGGISNDLLLNDNTFEINLPAMIYYKSTMDNDIYMHIGDEFSTNNIYDRIPSINWKIDKEKTKVIGGFTCKYATTEFRGTKLFAFFTEQIPVSFGPWKFKGLPGLIIEVGSFDSNFKWTLIAVNYPKESTTDCNVPQIVIKTSKRLKDIVQSSQKKLREKLKRLDSRSPKGTTVTSSTVKRNGLEQIFEWELEESEKN